MRVCRQATPSPARPHVAIPAARELSATPPHTPQELGGQLFSTAQTQDRQGIMAEKLPANLGGQLWQAPLPPASDVAPRCDPKRLGFEPSRLSPDGSPYP